MKVKMVVLSFLVVFTLSSCDWDVPFGYDPSDIKLDIIESSVSITFKGKISDADDSSPIQGAVVKLQTYANDHVLRYSDPVETDKDGRYSLYYEGILGHGWTFLLAEVDG